MAYPTIIFHHRLITVVEGTPFYCSSGVNSGHSVVWFPFLMLVGSKQIRIPTGYQSTYKISAINFIFGCNENNYIMKYSTNILQQSDIDDLCDGRLPTLESVRISLALGSNLNEIEEFSKVKSKIDLAQITPIKLNRDALHYESPDQVNEWLVKQGAVFASQVLTAETRPPISLMKVHSNLMNEFNQ